MRNKTCYEWDVEEWTVGQEDGEECLDHDHTDDLKSRRDLHNVDGKQYQLVLVKYVWNDADGVIDKVWAYTERVDGKWVLPDYFSDSFGCDDTKVPKRFHDELKRVQC